MNIANKIWYTWLLFTIMLCLTTWTIDEDKHPMLVNVLVALIAIPVIIGLTGLFVWLIILIWK